MIPVFILGFAVVALVKFGIAQWRLILLSAADYQLSESLHLSTGIDTAAIGPQDFGKLKGFCDGLSPEMKKTSSWLRLRPISDRSRLRHSIPECGGENFSVNDGNTSI